MSDTLQTFEDLTEQERYNLLAAIGALVGTTLTNSEDRNARHYATIIHTILNKEE